MSSYDVESVEAGPAGLKGLIHYQGQSKSSTVRGAMADVGELD